MLVDLTVHARPRSRTEEVKQEDDGTYTVHVKEPPDKGKANKAIVRLLAKHFHVPVSDVSIVKGATSTTKIIRIDGITL
nr:DUF167 domain-containing protein [Candidatus Sigynarchaeota archaeon]